MTDEAKSKRGRHALPVGTPARASVRRTQYARALSEWLALQGRSDVSVTITSDSNQEWRLVLKMDEGAEVYRDVDTVISEADFLEAAQSLFQDLPPRKTKWDEVLNRKGRSEGENEKKRQVSVELPGVKPAANVAVHHPLHGESKPGRPSPADRLRSHRGDGRAPWVEPGGKATPRVDTVVIDDISVKRPSARARSNLRKWFDVIHPRPSQPAAAPPFHNEDIAKIPPPTAFYAGLTVPIVGKEIDTVQELVSTVERLRREALAFVTEKGEAYSVEVGKALGCSQTRAKGILVKLEKLGALESALRPGVHSGLPRRYYKLVESKNE
jgi:hypothetical protein